MSYDVSVQMMEIYNEQVRDLLVTDDVNKIYPWSKVLIFVMLYICCLHFISSHVSPQLLSTLEIRNNSQNGINVPDANIVPVTSTSDVINLMNLGLKNRAVGSTSMNDRSSRSHRHNFLLLFLI